MHNIISLIWLILVFVLYDVEVILLKKNEKRTHQLRTRTNKYLLLLQSSLFIHFSFLCKILIKKGETIYYTMDICMYICEEWMKMRQIDDLKKHI